MFVPLPVHVVCNHLSPQLSSLLHTRMADYSEDVTRVISSCDPLKTLHTDHSCIIQENCNSSLPLNWSVNVTIVTCVIMRRVGSSVT